MALTKLLFDMLVDNVEVPNTFNIYVDKALLP